MSTSHDFGGEPEDREWEAQELALREEQLGTEPDTGDARVNQYRLLVRALRNPPLDPMPHDFAAQTAARAERRGVEDDRLEVWLQSALLGLLAAAGIWTIAQSGGQSVQALALVIPESAAHPVSSWGAAILVCVALSSLLEHWRRRLRGTQLVR